MHYQSRSMPWEGCPMIAHRGLHGGNIPENSLPAFQRASAAGFGVELDVQLTRDGEVVVFHDATLKRLCGDPRRVSSCTLAELQALRLGETNERIPLLLDVLRLLDPATPLVVELKASPHPAELCRKTLTLLQSRSGHCLVESFDPRPLYWFRRHAPEFRRGLLGFGLRYADTVWLPFRLLVASLLPLIPAAPDVLVWDHQTAAARFRRLRERRGCPVLYWTVRDAATAVALQSDCSGMIFEAFVPQEIQYGQDRDAGLAVHQ